MLEEMLSQKVVVDLISPYVCLGTLLRVDLTRRRVKAEPWSPAEMREQLGGIGRRAVGGGAVGHGWLSPPSGAARAPSSGRRSRRR